MSINLILIKDVLCHLFNEPTLTFFSNYHFTNMSKLNTSQMSECSLNSLASVKIYSVLDFIQADVEKIKANSDLSAEVILSLKQKFITDSSSKPINGYNLYLSTKNNIFIKTHIQGLDKLLEGGVMKGSILEFCGPVGSGKTQLSLSIAVNAAASNTSVLYIDTKFDFSASRCNKLLPSSLSDEEMDRILENINVYTPRNIYKLISTLDTLQNQFKKSEVKNRIIIIDSLTAPYLPLVGISSNKGLSLLSHISSSLKELATSYNLAIIITNLGVKYFEEEEEQHKRDTREIKPLLGKYWLHVPNTRILINRETPFTTKRSLCVQKSDYIQMKKSGEINITDKGVT